MSNDLKLSDVADFVTARTSIENINVDNYISTENMIVDKGGVTKATNLPPSKTVLNYKKNDILISNIRLYFKKIWLANKSGGASSDVLILRTKGAYSSRFIYYLLSDSNFFRYADVTSKGTKMPRGDKNAIMKYNIPRFDISIQRQIANVLTTYDKLIENNNHRIEVLEQTAEEIYKEWFVRMRFPGYENTKFDKGIPEGWEVRKVNELVDRFRYGTLYKQGNVEEEGEVIVIDQSEKEFLGYHNEKADHFADINNPFILFGDHSCKMLVMTNPFSLSENVIPFKSKADIPGLFLYYTVKDLVKTTEYKRHWAELTNKKVLMPEHSLQLDFEKIIKNNFKLIHIYKQEKRNLIKQRDLLLPRLMNSTIEVK